MHRPATVDEAVSPELPPPRKGKKGKGKEKSVKQPSPGSTPKAKPRRQGRPQAAPRTGKAARPLPPLPGLFVLENDHAEGSSAR